MIKRKLVAILIIGTVAVMSLAIMGPTAIADTPGAGNTEWYVAEGSTAVSDWGTYMTYISIANNGPADANIDIEFQTPEGPVNMPTFIMNPTSAVTVTVNDHVPNNWSVSTHVTSNQPVVVDRYMLYQRPGEPAPEPRSYTWAHGSIGVNAPFHQWYLAEGSTGRDDTGHFETWILIQNPTGVDADIDMKFQTPAGEVQGPQETVEARQRMSYNVSEYVDNEWSVSTTVETADPTQLVVCERAMYWYTQTEYPLAQCAHASIGTTEPGYTWFLAEGSTGITPVDPTVEDNAGAGNFESWILVQNPNEIDAMIDINFQTPAGLVPGPQAYIIRAGSRHTFDVSEYVPNEWSVSTTVEAELGGSDVIAERAMYWNFPQQYTAEGNPNQWKRYCGHDSIGAMNPYHDWELAGMITGWVDETAGFDSWLLVQNPNDFDVDIEITYVTLNGQVVGPAETLAANTRKSYNVGDTVPAFTETVGARVITTAPGPEATIIAEHSTYWGFGQGEDPQGYRQAAWDSIGYANLP